MTKNKDFIPLLWGQEIINQATGESEYSKAMKKKKRKNKKNKRGKRIK